MKRSYAQVVNNLSKTIDSNLVAQPKLAKLEFITAHPDSGASGNYIMKTPNMITESARPISVGCPNGHVLTSTSQTKLSIPDIPSPANSARVFSELKTGNLLSIGQLCDSNCTATFSKTTVSIKNEDDKEVLNGPRDRRTGLWTVDIPLAPPTETPSITPATQANLTTDIMKNELLVANGVIRAKTTRSDLAKYHHASLGSPSESTIIPAIKAGFLKSFPGLDEDLVRKHLPKSIETSLGHMTQSYQGTQSTSKPAPSILPDDDLFLPVGPEMTNNIMAAVHDISHRDGAAFGDLTGRYPVPSNKGNNYILVIYNYDANAILAEPMKTRNKGDILKAYRKIHAKLVLQGLKPKLQMLDNETSNILLDYMTKNKIDIQLAPPHMHRRNLAERAIRTFKEHFVSIRAGCDPRLPKNLWCRLIPQAVITLNLMRPSRLHPKLSAYAHIHGEFDYNRTPLAPPGSQVLVHEKPKQRGSWDDHGLRGWYMEPAMAHYRCYTCYIPATNGERISDTVEFFPHVAPMPQQSSRDQAIQAIRDLIHTIRNPTPATPFPTFGPTHTTALSQLADIFQTKEEYNVPEDPIPTAPITRVPAKKAKSFPAAPTRVQAPVGTKNTTSALAAAATTIDDENAALLQSLIDQDMHMLLANSVVHPETGLAMEYKDLINDPLTKRDWDFSAANEFGRLMQGVGDRMKTGTGTMFPIKKSDMPSDRTATYMKFVCAERPQKDEQNRTRLTMGGNLITYPGDVSTPTADMLTAKILINSTISDKNARWLGLDLKDFYLNNDMERYEYGRIPYHLIPIEIREQYNLDQLVANDGHIYFEVRKGMYGLPQAGIIAYHALRDHLQPHGYQPCRYTPGLWKHDTRDLRFCLVVDDFGVKYKNKDDANHLIAALQEKYEVTIDWTGHLFCGITLTWDYINGIVILSMPGYVIRVLRRLKHVLKKLQDAPHPWNEPAYGQKVQYAETDETDALNKELTTLIQVIVGCFLFYARAVDPTMLTALNAISQHQSKPTQKTLKTAEHFLDYCASHPDAAIKYVASDMQLWCDTDAAYLVAKNARSRVAGHFYLSDKLKDPKKPQPNPTPNGPLHTEVSLIKNVVASSTEAEIASTFHNGKLTADL